MVLGGSSETSSSLALRPLKDEEIESRRGRGVTHFSHSPVGYRDTSLPACSGSHCLELGLCANRVGSLTSYELLRNRHTSLFSVPASPCICSKPSVIVGGMDPPHPGSCNRLVRHPAEEATRASSLGKAEETKMGKNQEVGSVMDLGFGVAEWQHVRENTSGFLHFRDSIPRWRREHNPCSNEERLGK